MIKTRLQRLTALVLLLAATASLNAQSYTAIDLGNLGGAAPGAFAFGINNAGQVVGESYYFDEGVQTGQAFLYSSGTMVGLGRLPGTRSASGYDINDSGQIVGAGGGKAFVYSNGVMSEIIASPISGSGAHSNNNSGQIAGYYGGFNPGGAFLYTSGSATNLGGNSSQAYGINDAGQVVGDFIPAGNTLAFIYSSGVMTSLGTLTGANSSRALAINNNGQIVGSASGFESTGSHAFLYSNGVMQDLGVMGAGSQATGINDSGTIVGYSFHPGVGNLGFVVSNGTMQLFDSLIQPGSNLGSITLSDGGSGPHGNPINDWGQIAAWGKSNIASGNRAVLLNPVDPLSSTSVDGTSRNTKFVDGMDYDTFTAFTNPDGLGTEVYLLDGTAGSNGAGAEFGVNRDVTVSFTGADNTGLASDIASLTGTLGDVIVLSLTYDNSLYGDNVALGWFDGDEWVLAIDGNTGTPGDLAGFYSKSYADFLSDEGGGVFNSITMLGAYGGADGEAWAIINHNSEFAVLPEPSTCALLALGTSALLLRRRKARA